MGAEHGLQVVIDGVLQALERRGLEIVLIGDEKTIGEALGGASYDKDRLRVRHASQVVGMNEHPGETLRRKKDSSIRVCFELARRGEAHAVVSAGNSGAVMATAMFLLRNLEGVERPAIATMLPSLNGPTVILDAGANVDCRAHHLVQFAVMGSIFAQNIAHIYNQNAKAAANPRVGVLSNGEEETKGNEVTRETHRLLRQAGDLINYIGYVEGRDIYLGDVDVVVCDGMLGNVCLKISEGLAEMLAISVRREFERSVLGRLGYLLSRGVYRNLRQRYDWAEYGGAPLLGVNGVSLVCHGGSNAKAIKNAVWVAAEYVRRKVNDQLREGLVTSKILTNSNHRHGSRANMSVQDEDEPVTH